MRSKRYYWMVAVLALLFVFVVLADVVGFVGLFTGKAPEQDASVGADAVVTVSATEDSTATEDAPAATEGAPAAAEDAPAENNIPAGE